MLDKFPLDDKNEIIFWDEIINKFEGEGPRFTETEHLAFSIWKELSGYRVQDSGYIGRVPLPILSCMLDELGHQNRDTRLLLIEKFIIIDDVYIHERNEKTQKEIKEARERSKSGNKETKSKSLMRAS